MNAFVSHTLPMVLLGLLCKSALLLLASWAVCGLLRRASAATRHLVWSAALGGLLLLPVSALLLPHWDLAWRPTAAITVRSFSPVTGLSPNSPRLVFPSPQREGEPLATAEQGSLGSSAANGVADGKPLPPVSAPRLTRPIPVPIPWRLVWPVAGWTVWLLGIFVLLARLAVGLRRVELIRRAALPLESSTLAFADSLCASFGLRRPVAFLRASAGSGVAVPLTWGGRHPTVLLPEQSGTWSEDNLRAALLHELAHVLRWDWTTQIMSRLTCALYWVNPLVWLAARAARAESERACDDCVLQTGLSAADYAQRLVDVVRSMPEGTPTRTVAIAMAQPSEIEGRLQALLAKGRNRGPLTRKLALGTLAFFLLLALPLAALRLVAQAQITLTMADAVQPAPGGGTIRLVGIGEFPEANKPWWGKDGVRLPAPPTWSIGKGLWMEKAPQGLAYREVVFEATETAPGDDFTANALPNMSPGFGSSAARSGSPAHIGLVGEFSLAQKTCTVRVGIAHTPWQTLTTTERLGGSSSGSADGLGSYSVSFSTPSEIKGQVAYTIADTVMGLPTRVVAIDTYGRTVEGDPAGGNSSTGVIHQWTVTFPTLALKDIKQLQFQWQPYDWIEFKNVPLQPLTITDTTNRQGEGNRQGEVPSPLRTVAPTSRIVPLVSVSMYPPNAASWWDTQGVRLPGPPKFTAKEHWKGFTYPKGQQGRVFTVEIAKTRSTNDFMVDFPPSLLDNGTYSGAEEGGSIIENFFPAAKKTCRIRLGEASQPWQTLASHPNPLNAFGKYSSLSGRAAGVGTYTARFSPPVVNRRRTTFTISCAVTPSPASLCETRVVAINARGETVLPEMYPYSPGTTRRLNMVPQAISFPTPLLKDIKELRIQWRPFDWVEIKNVPLQPIAAAPQKETAMKNPLIAHAIALAEARLRVALAQKRPLDILQNAGMIAVQRQELLNIAQKKYKAGLVSASAVAQAKTDLREAQMQFLSLTHSPAPAQKSSPPSR